MISVCDSILAILNNGEQANACIEWAEKEEYPIHMKHLPNVSLQKAQSIVDEWIVRKDAVTPKTSTFPPPLSKWPLTVKDLYEYLGTLLATDETIQNAQLYHVEFGATTQTQYVEYEPMSSKLILG